MPKTRNVTRAQWDSANASHASATRSRRDKENGYESEKENGARQVTRATRSQTARGRTSILGAMNPTAAPTSLGRPRGAKLTEKVATKTQTATKGKGKPKASPLKRKKMPLQDITSQFLPAPEPANRGLEHQNLTEEELAIVHAEPANIISTLAPTEAPLAAPKFTSPLPPSSPPSPLVSSPVHPLPHDLAKSLFPVDPASPIQSLPQTLEEVWQEIDTAQPATQSSPRSASTASDPFGFVALERKLRAERELVAAQHQDHDAAAEDDELGHVLVADTSSPRPVPRLKRPLFAMAPKDAEEDNNKTPSDSVLPSAILPHVHYATPPSPHKDKKYRRLSHEGHDIFSPCDSSVESSPSPTKGSARKRSFQDTREDPLDEFNDELERSRKFEPEDHHAGKKTRRAESVDPEAVSRNLRTRIKKPEDVAEDHHSSPKRPHTKAKAPKKATSKARAAAKKEKTDASGDEEVDLDEKWEKERQERIEYFDKLELYAVEEENVYVI
ncbi:hypothetical protein BDN70DRAFT_993500 [Pholiota conissans]|uniref:Uncharacterized protein n=1 Tax=Pholiota conissans TaxID=109636 RepID=A0A9P6D0I8_9AGAR|nr:hypothetical protein BDN70DRAFT_993500 [Pholiota conissans]